MGGMRNLPDVPTLDVFVGLLSAILLLLALVYVARQRPQPFESISAGATAATSIPSSHSE